MSTSGDSRSEALASAWREFYARAEREDPRHPAARDFLADDLKLALRRLVPPDASVLEVGSGRGDLLAALPNPARTGVDARPEAVAAARQRHPGITFMEAEAEALG